MRVVHVSDLAYDVALQLHLLSRSTRVALALVARTVQFYQT